MQVGKIQMGDTGDGKNQEGVKNSRKLIKEKSSARHALVYNQVSTKNPPKRKSRVKSGLSGKKATVLHFFALLGLLHLFLLGRHYLSSPPLFLEVRVYTATANQSYATKNLLQTFSFFKKSEISKILFSQPK